MKAIVYTKFGSPEVLKLMEVKKPVPNDNQVLIRVKASSVNVTEYKRFTKQLNGEKTPLSVRLMDTVMLRVIKKIPGCDVSGIVEEVGKNVTSLKKGDEVFGITANLLGGWAEYACADEKLTYLKPINISFEEAAVVPTAAGTAYGAIQAAKVKNGQHVLVFGASGGVGQFVVQLSKAKGATVTAVCSTRNLDMARSIGADHVIDYKKEDFVKSGIKYDVIIGVNGYRPISTYKKALADNGTYIFVGGTNRAMMGALTAPLFFLGSGKKFGMVAFLAIKDKGLPFFKEVIENGKVSPFIDKIYHLDEVTEAIRYIIKEHAQGKIVITID